MVDLHTHYLGLRLRSPLVAAASPLTGKLDDLCRLEAAGAAAVVLPSLFQEQLTEEARVLEQIAGAARTRLSSGQGGAAVIAADPRGPAMQASG